MITLEQVNRASDEYESTESDKSFKEWWRLHCGFQRQNLKTLESLKYMLSKAQLNILANRGFTVFEKLPYDSEQAHSIVKSGKVINVFDSGFSQAYLCEYQDCIYHCTGSTLYQFERPQHAQTTSNRH